MQNNLIKLSNKNVLGLCSIIVLLILVFTFNFITPYMTDDYSYCFVWGTQSESTYERVENLEDIFRSQCNHYRTINGRIIVHSIAQLFLSMPKVIFDVFNAFAYVSLLFLIYFMIFGTYKNIRYILIWAIHLILWFFVPAFGEDFLWLIGSCNYLWGMLFLLIFLIPYRKYMHKIVSKTYDKNVSLCKSIMFCAAVFVLGIFAGWTNENTSIACALMICLLLIYFKINSITIKFWIIGGLVGNIIGCLLLIYAPGTRNRLSTQGTSGIIEWIKQGVFITLDLFEVVGGILLVMIVLGLICKYRNIKKKEIVMTYMFSFGALVATYSMVASKVFSERVWSGPIILLIIAVGNLFKLIDFTRQEKKYMYGCIVGGIIIFSASYLKNYLLLKQVVYSYEQREDYIVKEVSMGNTMIEVPTIKGHSKFSCYNIEGDLVNDYSKWPNTAIARYYGADKIVKHKE